MNRSTTNDYDTFAAAYAADNEVNPWNAHDERRPCSGSPERWPAARVLDAGCGAGALSAALLERGATLAGIDSSRGLLALAAERLGDKADLHHGDLRDPLRFKDETFDLVVTSLVMHYLPDWNPALREFHRVLWPGGRLVISTHHPFMNDALAGGPNYFTTYDFTETWQRGEHRYGCASGTDP